MLMRQSGFPERLPQQPNHRPPPMEYQQCSLHKHHHLGPGERHLRQPQVQLPRLQMESQVQVPGLVQLQMTQLELSHQQWKLQLS